MKTVTMKAKPLADALATAARVGGGKGTIPALQYMLMEPDGPGAVRMTTTNLDVAVRMRDEARHEGDGGMLLPAALMAEATKLLPFDDTVTLVADGGTVKMSGADGYRGNFRTLPASEFVVVPTRPEGQGPALPCATLSALLSAVGYAASTEPVGRYFMGGANIEVAGGKMSAVATDSRRLAYATVPCAGDLKMLVPVQALRELRVFTEGVEATVTVTDGENHLFFTRADGRELVSKRVDGNFPDWSRVMPKGDAATVSADRDVLTMAVRRMVVMSEDTVGVLLKLSKDLLSLACSGEQSGDATDKVIVDYSGGDMEARFNGRYLLDALAAAPVGPVQLELYGNRLCILRPRGESLAESFCLVMPLR